jgi:hypothetical protein
MPAAPSTTVPPRGSACAARWLISNAATAVIVASVPPTAEGIPDLARGAWLERCGPGARPTPALGTLITTITQVPNPIEVLSYRYIRANIMVTTDNQIAERAISRKSCNATQTCFKHGSLKSA